MILEEVGYADALLLQRRAAARLSAGEGRDTLFVLAHPPVVTLGRKADPAHLLAGARALDRAGVALARVERGGDVTYHGPGQVVGYPVFAIARRGLSPPAHVALLERAMERTIGRFGIAPLRIEGVRGVFAAGEGGAPAKIGAVGVAVSRGVAFHGLALNVTVDPARFALIVPCGLHGIGVTSMHRLVDPCPEPGEAADVLVEELRALYGGGFDVVSRFDSRYPKD